MEIHSVSDLIVARCIEKRKNNKQTLYILQDGRGVKKAFDSEELKNAIRDDKIFVSNLTLTSDNRLMSIKDTNYKPVANLNYYDVAEAFYYLVLLTDGYDGSIINEVAPIMCCDLNLKLPSDYEENEEFLEKLINTHPFKHFVKEGATVDTYFLESFALNSLIIKSLLYVALKENKQYIKIHWLESIYVQIFEHIYIEEDDEIFPNQVTNLISALDVVLTYATAHKLSEKILMPIFMYRSFIVRTFKK